MLRAHNRFVCAGNPLGRIDLRDPNGLKVEHSLDTHSGSLSDFDIQGNLLVTCGFSSRLIMSFISCLKSFKYIFKAGEFIGGSIFDGLRSEDDESRNTNSNSSRSAILEIFTFSFVEISCSFSFGSDSIGGYCSFIGATIVFVTN